MKKSDKQNRIVSFAAMLFKLVASYIILLIILAIIAGFTGCKTHTVYVPTETVKTEYRDKLVRDSIRLYDSVFVDRWKNGDTVFLTKEKYKYLYRDKLVRDSVFITDSIQVPYPVVEKVEVNRLHAWQIVLMVLGGVLVGYVGFRLFRLFK